MMSTLLNQHHREQQNVILFFAGSTFSQSKKIKQRPDVHQLSMLTNHTLPSGHLIRPWNIRIDVYIYRYTIFPICEKDGFSFKQIDCWSV